MADKLRSARDAAHALLTGRRHHIDNPHCYTDAHAVSTGLHIALCDHLTDALVAREKAGAEWMRERAIAVATENRVYCDERVASFKPDRPDIAEQWKCGADVADDIAVEITAIDVGEMGT
jgi:hypothetical protein